MNAEQNRERKSAVTTPLEAKIWVVRDRIKREITDAERLIDTTDYDVREQAVAALNEQIENVNRRKMLVYLEEILPDTD